MRVPLENGNLSNVESKHRERRRERDKCGKGQGKVKNGRKQAQSITFYSMDGYFFNKSLNGFDIHMDNGLMRKIPLQFSFFYIPVVVVGVADAAAFEVVEAKFDKHG